MLQMAPQLDDPTSDVVVYSNYCMRSHGKHLHELEGHKFGVAYPYPNSNCKLIKVYQIPSSLIKVSFKCDQIDSKSMRNDQQLIKVY